MDSRGKKREKEGKTGPLTPKSGQVLFLQPPEEEENIKAT